MAEAFPPSWLRPEAEELVLDFIKHLPVDAKVKKRTLYEWCKSSGVEMTVAMVVQVTGLPGGEI